MWQGQPLPPAGLVEERERDEWSGVAILKMSVKSSPSNKGEAISCELSH